MKLENQHKLLIFLALIFTYLTFYLPYTYYDLLPDMIPVHFNFFGEADKWAAKSIASVFMGPFILGLTILIMLFLGWWITKSEDPLNFINAPKEKLAKLSLETAEEIRRFTLLHLLIITFLISVMSFVVTINQILIALGQPSNLAFSLAIITFILVADSLYLTYKTWRLIG